MRGDRSDSERSPLQYRLKRSLEIFPASTGSIYLINDGLDLNFEIENPTDTDLAVLEILSSGFISQADLQRKVKSLGLPTDSVAVSIQELGRSSLLEKSDGPSPLEESSLKRYDRQLIYFADLSGPDESADEIQRRLSEAHVVVLGCGGLGSWAASGLGCAGAGKLTLVDYDTVDVSNLNRQVLFGESDVGRLKVEVAAEALTRQNSELEIREVTARIESPDQIIELIQGCDLLLGLADWPPYEMSRWMNLASLEAGVPLLTAGQFPPLIRIGPMVLPGDSSCLACQEGAVHDEYPLYGELADFRKDRPTTASTLGAASGLIGSILAMEAIHLISGKVTPASVGRTILMDLRTLTMEIEPVHRYRGCRCETAVPARL